MYPDPSLSGCANKPLGEGLLAGSQATLFLPVKFSLFWVLTSEATPEPVLWKPWLLRRNQKATERVACVFFPSGLFSSLLSKRTRVRSWLLHTCCGGRDGERWWESERQKRVRLLKTFLIKLPNLIRADCCSDYLLFHVGIHVYDNGENNSEDEDADATAQPTWKTNRSLYILLIFFYGKQECWQGSAWWFQHGELTLTLSERA